MKLFLISVFVIGLLIGCCTKFRSVEMEEFAMGYYTCQIDADLLGAVCIKNPDEWNAGEDSQSVDMKKTVLN